MILNKCNTYDVVPIDLDNGYYLPFDVFTDDLKKDNHHRVIIGGPIEQWDYIGKYHLDILTSHGLMPDMKMLDIGCGPLRVGCKLIDYLDSHNYYGIDVNLGLIEAGITCEIPKYNLQHKITDKNFIVTDDFSIEDFDVKFDFGFAHSVFTHLHYDKLEYFLRKCYGVFTDDCKIIMSFVVSDTPDIEYKRIDIAEPYRYSEEMINTISHKTGWKAEKLFVSFYDHTFIQFTKDAE